MRAALKKSYVDVFNPSGAPSKPLETGMMAPLLPAVTPTTGFFIPGAPAPAAGNEVSAATPNYIGSISSASKSSSDSSLNEPRCGTRPVRGRSGAGPSGSEYDSAIAVGCASPATATEDVV